MAYTTDPALDEMDDADLDQLILDAQAERLARDIDAQATETLAAVQAVLDVNPNAAAIIDLAKDAKDGMWVVVDFDKAPLNSDQRKWLQARIECIIALGNAEIVDAAAIIIRVRKDVAINKIPVLDAELA